MEPIAAVNGDTGRSSTVILQPGAEVVIRYKGGAVLVNIHVAEQDIAIAVFNESGCPIIVEPAGAVNSDPAGTAERIVQKNTDLVVCNIHVVQRDRAVAVDIEAVQSVTVEIGVSGHRHFLR